MTPLTNQKLVEALTNLSNFVRKIEIDIADHTKAYILIGEANNALKEASAPMKEFPPGSGMTKFDWETLARLLDHPSGWEKEMDACRQIAESLET